MTCTYCVPPTLCSVKICFGRRIQCPLHAATLPAFEGPSLQHRSARNYWMDTRTDDTRAWCPRSRNCTHAPSRKSTAAHVYAQQLAPRYLGGSNALPCPATPPALLGAVLVTMRFIGWQSDQNPPLPLLLDVLGMSICRECHLGLAAPRFRAQSAGMWVTWRRHFSVSQGNSQRPHMVSL